MLGASSKASASLPWSLIGTYRQSILHGPVARQCAKSISASYLYFTAAIAVACPGLLCLFNRHLGMQELEFCHGDVHVVKTLHSQLLIQQQQHYSCSVPNLCSCSVKSQQQVWRCALYSSPHDACASNRNHCRQSGLINCSLTETGTCEGTSMARHRCTVSASWTHNNTQACWLLV